ncbi:hypothetical protein Tsubulata_008468 [Turnera subulata]|uniref:F-box protein At3g54460 n=1 Tax=Turnera subulata TaxID=218843 RepID=A0A9Q0GBN0_9ROSI|nr:hypothetical protein Tsubulata_008468 [Turnera subulata]
MVVEVEAGEDKSLISRNQNPYPDHKLCGFLCTVLSVSGSAADDPTCTLTIPPLSPCHLITPDDHTVIHFQSQDGAVLSPIDPANDPSPRKRRSIPGKVNGSAGLLSQIHALLSHSNGLKVAPRLLHLLPAPAPSHPPRAVVLVDVYLPLSLWSGWQFPRSRPIAASLFRHLSCDWGKRSAMLDRGGEYWQEDANSIWNLPDCHVLGCHLHASRVPHSSRKKRFELHHIFSTLPSVTGKDKFFTSRVIPAHHPPGTGMWDITDDILINILSALGPTDLVRVAATCHHLRSLAASIMPCMKLKLFPHQEGAVEWMLQRERNAQVLPHPLYASFSTEDGFQFYVNVVSGEIVTGTAPTFTDFRGGMFCDEPGLGKTITALSLILKTQGTIADTPPGVQVTWSTHNGDRICGYYELEGNNFPGSCTALGKRVKSQSARRGQISVDILMDGLSYTPSKRARLFDSADPTTAYNNSCPPKIMEPVSTPYPGSTARVVRSTRGLSRIKKNLVFDYNEAPGIGNQGTVEEELTTRKHRAKGPKSSTSEKSSRKAARDFADHSVYNETWVQCDACRKWRRLTDTAVHTASAWFCSMNTDSSYQSCRDPEEPWDSCESITYLPGFCAKGTSGGTEENISFFISVLKEHSSFMNSKTKKALTWLAKLSPDRLSLMETCGLPSPALGTIRYASGEVDTRGFHNIFRAFGLIGELVKGSYRWHYPHGLKNLAFDLDALRAALCEPFDSVRLYLSRATLIVVPSNLVDHWKTQIEKHVKPGQLRLCIWTDHRKPSAHSLAWDYDVVITTFSRLSAEWSSRKKSPMMQVHWLRVMLDEGHTLGSSLSLTNKLQMAISLTATNRWLLTGTPTPNTPNSQLTHLHPMLMFLHEEVYGKNQKSWETGVLRPFEAEMEEGRFHLLQLLTRCLISARKIDLKTIPPCIKKVTLLDFNEEHAKSYNELVVTVRRNILLADWNDPSHVESLLNPKQWKSRSATIRNIRLSCCVAGHIKVADAGQDIQDTMNMLSEKGLNPLSEQYALIRYYLQYGGNCLRCNEWCRLPIVTPCRHLLCLDCVALNGERCTFPGCDNLYEMQSPEILTRPENPNPKWPVPKDLIELQPSYKQADWQSTSSSKVAYLVRKLKALQGTNEGVGHAIDDCHDAMNIKEQTYPPSVSNNTMAQSHQSFCRQGAEPCNTSSEKVIIFSQFLEHIHTIEEQLKLAGINFAGMYSPMHSSSKMKSLTTFQHDATCMALLMDGSAALGLDLSFVNHVFLMEPIWDRSMEEQVISRAHRMGATRPIHVETLAMRGTIEEQMLEFLKDSDGCRKLTKEEFLKYDHEGTRTHRSLHDFAERNYLAHLSFVRTCSRT